ncbi:MAG: enoyl-CoA hydratase/isomerase family protein [Deltaproteobacteria bacterium]|nr:enoyl-CoA hydratase/isomerase family protein [Deltaproteobacteria bacterium]MBW2384740.1 enoyl-CoA hydratase/isomerase family protein [Deltaproteobacteria bacterium]MBW2699063.1 enoyl-CoA hydratase/isomerase family protein [Deltaproteobacteria bacterium]
MDLKVTRYEIDDGIATLTLNRPERLNSWTGRMHTEYRWILEQADDDRDVRVVVVTGAGRGFCAGADTAALETHVLRGGYDAGTPEDLPMPGYGIRPEFDADFAFQFGLKKPIIAAINGPAAGAGFSIACYADLRFAVRGAKLTTAHGRLALPAEFGLSWLLPRMIGLTKANDLLLSSRVFLTDEAMELGLLNALLGPDELMPHTYAYARRLVDEVSPGSLAATKRQIYTDLHRDAASAVRGAQDLLERMMKQDDYREAVAAWMEKRPPRWKVE